MQKARIILTILLFCVCFPAVASKLAIVKVPTAIIYADVDLKASIGTISQGTQIRVGNKFRKHDSVAYTTYQNKIVYIKIADLEIAGINNDLLLTQNRFKLKSTAEMNETSIASRGYLGIRLGQSIPGQKWQHLVSEMDTKTTPFYSLGIFAEYNHHSGPITVYTSYEYTTNTDRMLLISMYTLDFGLSYALFQNNFYSFDLFAGPAVSPGIIIYTEDKKYFTKGSGYGVNAGTTLRLFRSNKMSILLGASYRYQKLYGHNEIQLPGQYYRPTALNSLDEFRTFIGLSWSINI